MPGRISMATLDKRVQTMRELSSEAGKPMPTVAVIPPTSIERTRDEALKHVNIPGLLAWANKAKYAVKPPSGRFETAEDLSGQLIVGTPDDAIQELHRFEEVGTEHLVFDLRFKFDRWFDQIELLGKEVISRFRS
jgi:alkanesulfonate monooxygenase SsuD/methylene tetrahydromethanopterin reductase-like flavin-dependent oxidoreductase (luciferase family)